MQTYKNMSVSVWNRRRGEHFINMSSVYPLPNMCDRIECALLMQALGRLRHIYIVYIYRINSNNANILRYFYKHKPFFSSLFVSYYFHRFSVFSSSSHFARIQFSFCTCEIAAERHCCRMHITYHIHIVYPKLP